MFSRFLSRPLTSAELVAKLYLLRSEKDILSVLAKNPGVRLDEPGLTRAEQVCVTETLGRCAASGCRQGVEALLQAGAPLEGVAGYIWSPLGFAASGLQYETISLLLAHGAKVGRDYGNGYTPLVVAFEQAKTDYTSDVSPGLARTVAELLEAGADPLLPCGKNNPILPITLLDGVRQFKLEASSQERQAIKDSAALLVKAMFEPQRWQGKTQEEAAAVLEQVPPDWRKYTDAGELVRYFRSQQPKGKAPLARKATPAGGPGTV